MRFLAVTLFALLMTPSTHAAGILEVKNMTCVDLSGDGKTWGFALRLAVAGSSMDWVGTAFPPKALQQLVETENFDSNLPIRGTAVVGTDNIAFKEKSGSVKIFGQCKQKSFLNRDQNLRALSGYNPVPR